jgi:hypothetical protein
VRMMSTTALRPDPSRANEASLPKFSWWIAPRARSAAQMSREARSAPDGSYTPASMARWSAVARTHTCAGSGRRVTAGGERRALVRCGFCAGVLRRLAVLGGFSAIGNLANRERLTRATMDELDYEVLAANYPHGVLIHSQVPRRNPVSQILLLHLLQ